MPCDQALFRGDAPELVDRLIAASQIKPAAGYTGYGRELQPWVDDTAGCLLNEPLELGNRYNNNSNKHGRSPDRAGRGSPNKRAAPARRCSLDAAQGAFACPSFSAAPRPEALPMPSKLMLSARRSPSPPKSLPAMVAAA
ncbi:hypothetical protein Rsub_10168 [Raphidocelis subcapitata]|uniref:Uncharacterized protein n=1 Tax=Raphidocelis subcapitata TaxID=307507 RepID=A0A2V0PJS8_9CHLO|nr:hypothetical protein Rsub_10168 [Raphidocelis subcapitata]|eukprot:GBF97567.1 hypothetical protein Rsub_10168 [Raphidocelis subcapitata]